MIKNKNLFKANAISGFSTLLIREFILKFLSFAGQIVLARLLIPEDFGVYAIIVFLISFIGLFSDVGLSLAIIQKKKDVTHAELSNIFIFKILLAVLLILIIWIFAPLAQFFYPSFSNEGITMIRIFSLTLLFLGVKSVPIALLERKLKYNIISMIDVMGVATYYITALILAYFQYGVWSFIIGTLIKESAETVFLFSKSPFVPDFSLNIGKIAKMIRFGLFIQGNSILMFFMSSIIPVLGAKAGGPNVVGILDFANKLASFPGIIAVNFSRVAFATYSRIQNDHILLVKSINKSISMLSIILFIFPVIVLCFAYELVFYIYTDKWIAAVPALWWFSLAIFFYPIITSLGQVILSIGKSRQIFQTTLFTAVIGWISALILIRENGYVGIAMANLIIYFCLYISYLYIVKKAGFNVVQFILIMLPKFFAALLAILFGIIINMTLPQSVPIFLSKLMLVASVYFTLMLLVAREDTIELFRIIKSVVRKKNG